MGMYTELFLRCNIKGDAADPHIRALRERHSPDAPIDMMGHGMSYYFPAGNTGVFRFERDRQDPNMWELVVLGNIKNYHDQWARVMGWLAPHIEDEGWDVPLGWVMYEQTDTPTLIYLIDGAIQYRKPLTLEYGKETDGLRVWGAVEVQP